MKSRFQQKVSLYLSNAMAFLGRALGSVRWTPPPWCQRLKNQVSTFIRSNPRRALRSLGISFGVLLVVGGGYFWWTSLPKPQYCSVQVLPPQAPDLYNKQLSELRIQFGCSAALISEVGKAPAHAPEISDAMPGKWEWANDRVLIFSPLSTALDKDWKAGSEYTLKIRSSMLAEHVKLETSKIKFTPVSLDIVMWSNFGFNVDARNTAIRRVSGTISSNWPLQPESFRKLVKLSFEKSTGPLGALSSDIPVVMSFNPTFTEAYVSTEKLPVPEYGSTVRFLAKGEVELLSGGSGKVEIKAAAEVPGRKGSFKIQDPTVIYARNERFEPEQALVLNTNLEIESENVAKALKVWVLPAKHPKDPKTKENYSWSSFAEVTPQILASSAVVELEVLPTENPRSKIHSFRTKTPVEAHRFVYVEVDGSLTALGDYSLGDRFLSTLEVPELPKELRILGDGVLLSLSGDRKLSVGARGVTKARVEVSRVIPDQLNQLVRSISYQGMDKVRIYQGTTDAFSERFTKDVLLANIDSTKTEYFTVDMDNFVDQVASRRGLFYLRLSEVNGPTLDERLILVTDLGFVAKKSAQGAYSVFVQNLKSGLPVGEARVEVLGANGLSAHSVSTDASGRAELPALSDFKRERHPIALVVRKGESVSFLPLEFNDARALQMHRFDTGGVYESTESDSLTAMLFSDRGIYRPGEKVNIGGIVRSKNIRSLQNDIPMKWIVTDPRGNEIQAGSLKASTGNLIDISFDTRPNSPTGSWDVVLVTSTKTNSRLVLGSVSIRVEEFQPDRMKISSRFSSDSIDGWVDPTDLNANVTMQNLFGTPAQDRRVKAMIRVSPIVPRFKKLPGYEFSAIHAKEEQQIELPMSPVTTDVEGKVSLPLDLKSLAQGMYSLRFEAEGFETAQGGRSVMTASSVLVSRHPYLVGVKSDGSLSYIATEAERSLSLLAINSKLETVEAKNIEVALIENRWVSVLMQDPTGAYKYQSVRKEIPISSKKISLQKKALDFSLETKKSGDFTLILRNDKGIELNRVAYSVVGSGDSPIRLDRNAELQLTLSKTDYRIGEEIEMQIRAPYAGRGLITIERDHVYAHSWFESSGTSSVQRIRIPEGLEGNAYVSVSFLRDSGSKEIYMSPLSYAVAPFSLAREDFETKITLDAPELVKPGQKLVIKYSANRATDLTLWGVDEGIHLVAKYKAPSPLDFFLRKKALQVSSYQILDLLLPEYSVLRALLPAGGDEASDDAGGQNLNPFRRGNQAPVQFWSGVLKADGKLRSYTYEIPDYYNGNLKILAVASSRQGMGLAQASTLIRGDLILSPTAPLFAAPGDDFDVNVAVANQALGSGKDAKVEVSIAADAAFESVDKLSAQLNLAEGDETTHSFRLKAKDVLGSFPLLITARTKAGKEEKSASYRLEISLRPATPYLQSEEFRVAKSFPQTFKLEERRKELAKSSVLLSSNPLDIVKSLADFLEGFPYGCTEQVLSKALSQLVMRGRFAAGGSAPPVKDGFEAALSELRTRQRSDGGFALYSAGPSEVFPSLWALQYMIEAEGRGLQVPQVMIEQAIAYAENLSFQPTMTLAQSRWVSFGAYLVARSGRVPRMNLVDFETDVLRKQKDALSDLASVYLAATYKLLKQDKRGDALISKIAFGDAVISDPSGFYGTLVRDAGLLLIIARHFPERLPPLLTADNMDKFFSSLKSGQLQTLSAGLTLLALDSVANSSSFPNSQFKDEGSEQVFSKGEKLALKFRTVGIGAVSSPLNGGVRELVLKGSAGAPLFAGLTHSGFEMIAGLKEIKAGLEVFRGFRREDGTMLSGDNPTVRQDETLDVVLRLRSLGGRVDNIALVDLLPSGFEIVMDPIAEQTNVEEIPSGDADDSYEGEEGEGEARLHSLLVPSAYAQNSASMEVRGKDRREDRMVVYASATDKAAEFVYRVKAVSRGTFVVPPAFAESMYDRTKRYRGIPGKIQIVKPE